MAACPPGLGCRRGRQIAQLPAMQLLWNRDMQVWLCVQSC